MQNQTYIITRMQDRIFSFLQNDKRAVEIHCDAAECDSLLGSIYIGRIQNIAKNLNAAFVEIAPGQNCYLPLEDIQNPIYTKKGTSKLPQQGDELLVQISREGIKTKLPSVTTNLTLHGKYALLTTGNTQISVSSKLSKEVRTHLIEFAAKQEEKLFTAPTQESADSVTVNSAPKECTTIQKKSSDQSASIPVSVNVSSPASRRFGWLLRTNAGTADEALLARDMLRLYTQYQALIRQAPFRTCFSCIKRTPPAYLTRLSDLYDSSADHILTDDETLYEETKTYLEEQQPEDLDKLSLYHDDLLPLKKLYSLEHQLAEALGERVWLKSGGYLIIQPTEALTVIDVNSGKADGGKKKEAALLKVNKEAAVEIAHQLRLRNISGIVIVDFINMKEEESRNTLLSLLDAELKKDPIRTVLVDMTKLSLVEITRMKKEKPLHECVKH